MAHLVGAPADRLATYFVDYLFTEYGGSRHVRRVAGWVGLIVLGIEQLAGATWSVPRRRQLVFDYRNSKYKVKYNHKAGRRGGIDIVEVLPGRGAPEGRLLTRMQSLQDASQFFQDRLRGVAWP